MILLIDSQRLKQCFMYLFAMNSARFCRALARIKRLVVFLHQVSILVKLKRSIDLVVW